MTNSLLLRTIINFTKRLLVVILMMFLNVFICFSTAGMVMLQLLNSTSIDRRLCLIAAIMTAIGVQLFIVYHHKLRHYIDNGAGSNE